MTEQMITDICSTVLILGIFALLGFSVWCQNRYK